MDIDAAGKVENLHFRHADPGRAFKGDCHEQSMTVRLLAPRITQDTKNCWQETTVGKRLNTTWVSHRRFRMRGCRYVLVTIVISAPGDANFINVDFVHEAMFVGDSS